MTKSPIRTRGEMIQQLIAHSVDTAVSEPQRIWLSEIFSKGFVGYNKLSDRQLLLELQLRGLILDEDTPT